jgi:hypothetical protein
MGSNFKSLWGVISGHNSIKPYTYTAFRILFRIANILDGVPDLELHDPYMCKTSEEISDSLFEEYS